MAHTITKYVDADEVYPVFYLSDQPHWSGAGQFNLTPEDWADYERVQNEYDTWQARMRAKEYGQCH